MPTPDRYDPTAPEHLLEIARHYVATAHWVTARGRVNPHQYIHSVQRERSGRTAEHMTVHFLIRNFGIDRTWHGHGPYRGIDLDGWSLWLMEWGDIINRKPAEDGGWDQQEG